jgi:hypothetical protein
MLCDREAEDDGGGKGHSWRHICSYKNVARASQGCCKGVARVLQGCCEGVTRVLQGCYKGVARVLQGCYKGVIRVLQGEAEEEGGGKCHGWRHICPC